MGAVRAAAVAAALLVGAEAFAEEAPRPLLHPVFSDHAVLQRGEPIRVWGWAAPGARVEARLGGATRRVRAGRDGVWRAEMPAMAAGGPYTLEAASGAARAQISDVLIGDVYLCSGQSNMEFQTRYATNAYTVLGAANHNDIRLLNTQRVTADSPQPLFSAPAAWATATPASVGDFSAVCYFFGREMAKAAAVPVGLINASWGGTIIEAWTSDARLRTVPALSERFALMQLERDDPAAARAQTAARMRAWWEANDPGARAGWNAPDLDEAGWDAIPMGAIWENAGVTALNAFDGALWYRTEFTLTAEQAAAGGVLHLGPIDDIDLTYLNGAVIGATGGYDLARDYSAAPGALRAGRNVLAVAVLDTGGGGGLYAPAREITLGLSDGTRIALDGAWRYRVSAPMRAYSTRPPQAPTRGPNAYSALYNAMIAPLAPYNLAGVVWYQGESNTNDAGNYEALSRAWMADWRAAFAAPGLPFFITQLANYGDAAIGAPQESSWAALREAQRRVTLSDARAAMAVTYDIGDRFDIHPTQKLRVGERLALAGRRMLLGEDIAAQGPAPLRARREGGVIVIDYAHGPLRTMGAARPIGFEVCDEARACAYADASIDGARAVVTPGAHAANFVRFCWADAPLCNVYNDADLPAEPFELAVE